MSDNFTLQPMVYTHRPTSAVSVDAEMADCQARIDELQEAGYPEDSVEMRLAVARARVLLRDADEIIAQDDRRHGRV